jgi:hypothetical protein
MTDVIRKATIREVLETIAALPTLSYDKELNDPASTAMHIGLAEMHGQESAYRAVEELLK